MAKPKPSPSLEVLPASPSLAQTLPSDAVLDALKMIPAGAPLNDVLTTITHPIEAHGTSNVLIVDLIFDNYSANGAFASRSAALGAA
jgi:hypothetical protein